jgi:BTB/POZ domain-containing protein 1/2
MFSSIGLRVFIFSSAPQGPDSFYGAQGMNKVSVDVPTGSKVSFHFSFAAGNNNGTSVEDGQIPEILFYV